MLKLNKVAVTGGLSCGKSSVCRFLKELGAYVVSSDDIVHQLLSSNTNLGQEIIKLLGTEIVVDQKIDRSRIARIVFQDYKLLQALEEILHPAVYSEIDKEYQMQQSKKPRPPLFVAEVPLLYESGGENHFDSTVMVVSKPELCLKRFEQTTNYDLKEYERRMARQMPVLEKAERADYVILNDGTLLDLKQKTVELFQDLTQVHKK